MPELRRRLHDHAVLVELAIDGRDDRLAEGEVERRVDLARPEAQARRGLAVDDERGLQAAHFLVARDVGDLGDGAQLALEARRPGAQLLDVVGEQGELVVRVAAAPAGAHVERLREEELRARFLRELGAQARDHRLGGHLAHLERLELDEHEAAVPLAAAGEAGDVLDRRVGAHDADEGLHLAAHRLERDALVGAHVAEEAPGVLLREEALGDLAVQVEIQADSQEQDQHDDRRVAQRPAEADSIALQDGIENIFCIKI